MYKLAPIILIFTVFAGCDVAEKTANDTLNTKSTGTIKGSFIIKSMSPSAVRPGDSMTITGDGLLSVAFTINSQPVEITSVENTEATLNIPQGPEGITQLIASSGPLSSTHGFLMLGFDSTKEELGSDLCEGQLFLDSANNEIKGSKSCTQWSTSGLKCQDGQTAIWQIDQATNNEGWVCSASHNNAVQVAVDNTTLMYDDKGVLTAKRDNIISQSVNTPSLSITSNGTDPSLTGLLQFNELAANGNNSIGLFAPDSISSSIDYMLPEAPTSNGMALLADSDGRMFWGASSNTATGDIKNGGNDFVNNMIIGTNDNYSLQLEASNTVALTILPNGNIGIGQESPTAKLEIAGQIKITEGTPGAGKVLMSDDDGLATWETLSVTGDMLKSTFDANNDGKVDDSEKLNGKSATFYLNADNIDNGTINDARIPANITRDEELPSDTDDLPESSTRKYMSTTEKNKLTAIEDSADVTDSDNVAAAGAIMNEDFIDNGLMVRTAPDVYTVIVDKTDEWNMAYGWGDHATAGYISSVDWTKPGTIGSNIPSTGVFTSLSAETFTSTGIDDNALSTSITIMASGHVGIGTTSPDTNLDIDGQIKIRGGDPAEGKVLTSNALGLATWRTIPASGDMLQSTYDTSGLSGVVDDSEALNGEAASFYLNADNINAGILDDARLSANIARAVDIPTNTDGLSEGSTNKYMTAGERTKLASITAGADPTNATNVEAAGAIMNGDFISNGLMVRTAPGVYSTIVDKTAEWSTAYSWGNHATAGYQSTINWGAPPDIGLNTPAEAHFTRVSVDQILIKNFADPPSDNFCDGIENGVLLQTTNGHSLYRCFDNQAELVTTRFHHFFVTEHTYLPGNSYSLNGSNFNSREDADQYCQDEASNKGLPNANLYKAMIAGESTAENKNAGTPESHISIKGAVYTADWDGSIFTKNDLIASEHKFFSKYHAGTVAKDIAGNILDATNQIWTGVVVGDLAHQEFGGYNSYQPNENQLNISCNHWQSNSGDDKAKVGDPTESSFKWANTAGFGLPSTATCDVPRRFYCISQ